MPRRLPALLILTTLASARDKTTYEDQAFPIFQETCLNCHNPDKAKGGLDLSTFGATLKGGSGGKIVEPGDLGSTLIKALLPGAEKPMPPEGEKLPKDKIETLKRWVEGGLLENKSSSARKPSKPKFETTLRSNPSARPDGSPPMPTDLLLEPPVITSRATSIRAITTSPWAPLLAITGQQQILLHHTKSLELIGILPFIEGDPISLTFTPDARYLIVGGGVPGKSGLTVTFDLITGTRVLTVAKEFDSILAADIRPAFDLVATGGPSRLLKIWNTESGDLVRSIKKHTDWITALDFSDDGVLLASGDRNGGAWVWESDSGNEYQTLRGHQAGITATAFRSDSNILASASEDGTVRFWEMNGGSEVRKIDAHPGGVTAFAFARDGSSITAGRDLAAKLWKPDFNLARDIAKDLPALPTAVAIDSDAGRAFVADVQGIVRAYQTEDGKFLGEIHANPPTLDSRLQKLSDEISVQQQAFSAAGHQHSESQTALAEARRRCSELEKHLQTAIEIRNAAAPRAVQNPNDATSRILAEAESRLKSAEQALPPAKAALASAEKAVNKASTTLEAAQAALVTLNSEVKKWTAATINFKAITARHEAGESTKALEDSQIQFSLLAENIAVRAAILNAKRFERLQLTNQFKDTNLSTESAAELDATLAAIDIRIEIELEALKQTESEAILAKEEIESSAPVVHHKRFEAKRLINVYRKALD